MEVFKPYFKIMNFLWNEYRIPSTLAGGFVRDFIKEKPIKDADLFSWIPLEDIEEVVRELNAHFNLGLTSQDTTPYSADGRLAGGTLYSIYNSVDGVLPYPLQLMQYMPKTTEHSRIQENILKNYGDYVVSKFDLDICKAYAKPDGKGGEIVTTDVFEEAHEDKVIWIERKNFSSRGSSAIIRYKERIRRLGEKFSGYEVVWEGGEPGVAQDPFEVSSQSPQDQVRVMPGYTLSQAAERLLAGNHYDRVILDEVSNVAFDYDSARRWDAFDEYFLRSSDARRSRLARQEDETNQAGIQFQQDAPRVTASYGISSPTRREPAIGEHTIRRMQAELARRSALEEYRRVHEQALQSLPEPIDEETGT